MPDMPVSDLSRVKSHEQPQDWPMEIRVVAKWGLNKSTSFIITADEYFGRGAHGAPMNGDQLMQRIEVLRRAGSGK